MRSEYCFVFFIKIKILRRCLLLLWYIVTDSSFWIAIISNIVTLLVLNKE